MTYSGPEMLRHLPRSGRERAAPPERLHFVGRYSSALRGLAEIVDDLRGRHVDPELFRRFERALDWPAQLAALKQNAIELAADLERERQREEAEEKAAEQAEKAKEAKRIPKRQSR